MKRGLDYVTYGDVSLDGTSTSLSEDESTGSVSQCCSIWNSGNRRLASNARRKKPTPSEGERAVIKDLNALSIKEREDVYEEIHGIQNTNTIKESPEMIVRAVADLQEYIDKMKPNKKKAYELARLMSPRFVEDKDFMLMFLRADLFDVAKTATRLVNSFQLKLELFGIDKLAKHITWEDLDDDTRNDVQSYTIQYYPELVDNAGRTVWVAAMAHDTHTNDDAHYRNTWYTVMGMMMGNENAQKRGIVGIAHMVGLPEGRFGNAVALRSMQLLEALPYRYAALHMCYDNPRLKAALGAVQLVASAQTRVRFRTHFGTHMECQYELMAFGLNQSVFPIDTVGNLRKDRYREIVDMRRTLEAEIEEQRRNSSAIEYPTSKDVLSGRGKAFSNFAGNVVMTAFVDQCKSNFLEADSSGKKNAISASIVKTIKEKGGRFLKKCKDPMDGWVEISDGLAKEKVNYTFRARNK